MVRKGMAQASGGWRGLAAAVGHPAAVAVLPLLLLAAYQAGGERGLTLTGALLSLMALASALPRLRRAAGGRDGETGLPDRAAAVARLDDLAADGAIAGRRVAALAIGLERLEDLGHRHGETARRGVLLEAARRIALSVRADDLVVRLGEASFGVVLDNLRRADLEMLIQLSARVQRELSEPFHLEGARAHLTVSIGFCLPGTAPDRSGEGLLAGAERALRAASDETGGAIRAYSRDLFDRDRHDTDLADAAAEALARGEIRPWFQPQVSTDTGAVTGFEAVARWERPGADPRAPGDFLPALAASGLTERLGETILTHAMSALAEWETAGLGVPGVAVNLGRSELQNPRLADRVRWDLDRFDLAPERLVLEVSGLGTHGPNDEIALRTLRALSRLGCRIDLDQFGSGHAALDDIGRFGVGRLRIDRSFVARVDRDPERQRMVAAILAMADRLGLETVAGGVETIAEHAMLAQLGCSHVQGFAIAPPMPAAEVPGWLAARRTREPLPEIPGTGGSGAGRAGDGKTA